MGALAAVLVVLLGAPAAFAAGAPEPAPEAVLATIPFAKSAEANRVMVDMAPEGQRPFVMMVDTGANMSLVTPRMARELGIRVQALKGDFYRRPTRLGRDVQFIVDTTRSDTGARTSWEYGALGGDFLDDYVLEIDFPKRTVRFLDPAKYQVPEAVDDPSERALPMKVVASRPIVPIEVQGHALEVVLGTGVPMGVVLSGAAARAAGIEAQSLSGSSDVGTSIGPMHTSFYEAPAFQFAGFALGVVPMLVAPKGWYNQGAGNDSALGYDVLAPFVVRIDYPRKRLWLKRMSSDPIRLAGADYTLAKQSGAYMNPMPNGYAVWSVTPGSAAEKLGVRVGDVVVSSESNAAPPLDEVLHEILDGKELQVARKQGDLWVDHVLPESADDEPAD